LLAAVCTLPKAEVAQALNHLTAAEVLTCSGTLPNSVYTFKHALLQDWAYENQLKTERPKLHKSIARILEERFPDEVAAQPQVLADHYSKAGEYRQAIAYWQRAAKRSADRAAYAEALKHLGHALDHLDKLADGRERDKLELELRVALGLSLERTRGYSAPEVEQTYERARELCHKLGETVELVPVLVGLYVFRLVRANQKNDLTTALELAEQCVQLSKDSGRDDYLIDSYAAMGYVLCYLGRLDEAREVLEKRRRALRIEVGRAQIHDHRARSGRSVAGAARDRALDAGKLERVAEESQTGVRWADELGEPINHAIVCAHAAAASQSATRAGTSRRMRREGLRDLEAERLPALGKRLRNVPRYRESDARRCDVWNRLGEEILGGLAGRRRRAQSTVFPGRHRTSRDRRRSAG
jgi:tetratricopeptide (TPR) repeat protein